MTDKEAIIMYINANASGIQKSLREIAILILILGIVIIINQIRLRKQLRQIQEQLDATSDKNNAGGDNQGE